jgi:hypothetical protein
VASQREWRQQLQRPCGSSAASLRSLDAELNWGFVCWLLLQDEDGKLKMIITETQVRSCYHAMVMNAMLCYTDYRRVHNCCISTPSDGPVNSRDGPVNSQPASSCDAPGMRMPCSSGTRPYKALSRSCSTVIAAAHALLGCCPSHYCSTATAQEWLYKIRWYSIHHVSQMTMSS